MSDWTYVAIAFTVAWGGVAFYALFLARRVAQARRVELTLQELSAGKPAGRSEEETDSTVCDAPPAP